MATIIKLLLVIALIALIVFIYFSCTEGSGCMCRPIDKTLPSIEIAPYSVTTKTQLYYAAGAEYGLDGTVMMERWYERDAGEWIFHEESIIIPAVLVPVIKRR